MERSLKLPFTFALALGLYFLGGMFGIAKLSAALKRPCKRSAEAAKDTSWARSEPPMANKAPAFCNGCGALARCYSCATGDNTRQVCAQAGDRQQKDRAQFCASGCFAQTRSDRACQTGPGRRR